MSAYDDFRQALDAASLRVRDVVSITGFRLDGSRLYLDEGELSWIEIQGEVVHTRAYGEDRYSLGLVTVWIRRETETVFGQLADAEDYAAGYLKPSNIGGITAPGWYRGFGGVIRPFPTVTSLCTVYCPTSSRAACETGFF